MKSFEHVIYSTQGKEISGKPIDVKRYKKVSGFYSNRLLKFLPSSRDALIIDVPCGDGNILYFLADNGYINAKGADINADRINICKTLSLNAEVKDALEFLKSLHECDVIFCVDFLEHIQKEDLLSFLKLVKDSLKKGGVFIGRTPMTDSPAGCVHLHNDLTHNWAVNTGVWRQISIAAQFELISIIDERPLPTTPKGFLRWIIFSFARAAYTLQRYALSLPIPSIWTPSAWIVLKKID